MLVPATQSTGTRSCSSTSSTPMCAAPRAPPPPNTRPTRGRSAAARPDNESRAINRAGKARRGKYGNRRPKVFASNKTIAVRPDRCPRHPLANNCPPHGRAQTPQALGYVGIGAGPAGSACAQGAGPNAGARCRARRRATGQALALRGAASWRRTCRWSPTEESCRRRRCLRDSGQPGRAGHERRMPDVYGRWPARAVHAQWRGAARLRQVRCAGAEDRKFNTLFPSPWHPEHSTRCT